jgi:hypothetical protein
VMISTAPLVTDLKLRFKHSPKVMSFRHYPRLLPDGADRTLTNDFITHGMLKTYSTNR